MKEIQKKYWRRALIVAYFLQAAPFVRMVGLNGSLTRGEAKATSDIDFLIICKKNRIWTCRFFVTLITHLTGLRRYGNKVAGRICLNRYQTDDFLDIQPHNEYHAKVFSQLVPILEFDDIYEKYCITNAWMSKLGYKIKIKKRLVRKSILLTFLRSFTERILSKSFGKKIEKKLKKFQKNKISKNKKTKMAPKGRIRVSDKELCFHPVK